jgi:L-alanine-DL-glutamate epimerase-like enolase superfamily enzyme
MVGRQRSQAKLLESDIIMAILQGGCAPFACRILRAGVRFVPRTLVTPLVLSTGSIDDLTEAKVSLLIESESGLQAEGFGTIYLSDLWAWPEPSMSHSDRVAILESLTCQLATFCGEQCQAEYVHPLELGLRIHEFAVHTMHTDRIVPALARAMCASPFDAAVHDALGVALGCSAFAFYDQPVAIPSADRYFPQSGVIDAIGQLIQSPRGELPAWWIVNKSDPLPESMAAAYERGGYRCFKLKITGQNTEADVARTVLTYLSARSLGISEPSLVVDSNEANPDAESVMDYLDRLSRTNHDAYCALAYIEQPTGRDIRVDRFDWRQVARRKPVLLDEGLTDLSILPVALEQGWSGLALKTCKGHSMLLATAAWAHQHGMLLTLQDLTNPGFSLIHAALVGACLPTMNGAELNSPQFTPAANADFVPRLRGLFEPQQGVHRLPPELPVGLGTGL